MERVDSHRHIPSRESLVLYASVLVMGACGLAYEYTFSKLSSDLLGNSVKQWAIIIGVMMFFMGVGSDVQKHIRDQRLVISFVLGELALAVLGAYGPFAMLYAYGQFNSHYVLVQYFFVGAIGLLIGFEIPLLTRMNSGYLSELRLNLGAMLRMDYMGALVGALAWVFVLPKFFSLMEIAIILGLVTWVSAMMGLLFFWRRIDRPAAILGFGLAAGVLLAVGFWRAQDWELHGQQHLYQDPIVLSKTSVYQHIVVTQGKTGDTSLYINGHLQFNSIDEHIYHEDLVHPAMTLAQRHDRVLILGGGDGLAAREVLKYQDVKQLVLCDLDPAMTDLAAQNSYLVKLNQGSLTDARTQVLINGAIEPGEEYDVDVRNRDFGYPARVESVGKVRILNTDALKFLEQFKGQFDVVIIDFPDPNAPELAKLYSNLFYAHLKKRLAPGAIFVQQSTSPFWAKEAFLNIGRTMASAGLVAIPYHDDVPSFGEWGFWIGGEGRGVSESLLKDKLRQAPPLVVNTRYLTPELMAAQLVFGKGDLVSEHNDINTILSSRLHEYYLQGWQKTL